MATVQLLTENQLAKETYNLANVSNMPLVPSESASKDEAVPYLSEATKRFSAYEALNVKREQILRDPLMAKDQSKNIFSHFWDAFRPWSSFFFLAWIVICVWSWFSDNAIIKFITWKELLIADVIVAILCTPIVRKDRVRKQEILKEILGEIESIFSSEPFYELYSGSESFLGPKYRYSDAAASFTEYFINGRCSSIKEAKNLYEQELSTRRIENRLGEVEMHAQQAEDLAQRALNRADQAISISNAALATAAAAYSKASKTARKVDGF